MKFAKINTFFAYAYLKWIYLLSIIKKNIIPKKKIISGHNSDEWVIIEKKTKYQRCLNKHLPSI